ncbi:hypothetical protein KBD61_05045 [Patescibacteria group bacterium]|nr:hypothetical protein [Patescibacteria group bacterium]MBP9710357.1 hypothetical protein [Patescibacteria group bacterium]
MEEPREKLRSLFEEAGLIFEATGSSLGAVFPDALVGIMLPDGAVAVCVQRHMQIDEILRLYLSAKAHACAIVIFSGCFEGLDLKAVQRLNDGGDPIRVERADVIQHVNCLVNSVGTAYIGCRNAPRETYAIPRTMAAMTLYPL